MTKPIRSFAVFAEDRDGKVLLCRVIQSRQSPQAVLRRAMKLIAARGIGAWFRISAEVIEDGRPS